MFLGVEPGPSNCQDVDVPVDEPTSKHVEVPVDVPTSKDVDVPVDEPVHDPDDPLSPEYVPKPPPADEKVKEETTGESNGETGTENDDDNDIDEDEDEDDVEFDEDGGTNPLEPDVELRGDDDDDDDEGEGSGAAMFSSGGHFLNGGGEDDEEGGQEGGPEDVDMSKVKSEAIEHESGDESPKGEEEAEEPPRPKKPKPKHSVKGTFSCPMCPKVWGWPWELRRHVITHYKQVRQRTCEVCIVEMEPKFFTPLSLAERKGEGVKLQV